MQAMALAFIGGAIGLVDSWYRPVSGAAAPKIALGDLLGDDDDDTNGAVPADAGTTPEVPAPAPTPVPDPVATPAVPEAAATSEGVASPSADVPEWLAWDTRQEDWPANYVTVAEARRLIDRQQAQLIDARRADEYESGHIPGALRLNLDFFRSGDALDRVLEAGFDPDHVTIVYCGGGDCEESNRVAEELGFLSIPFGNVFVIKSGIAGWMGRGMPVETGPGGF